MPWHVEHPGHPMLKKLNCHGKGLRSILADHYQLSFLVGNFRSRSERCEDATVTPVVDLQRQEASSIMIENQADLTRVRPKAAAVNDDRCSRLQRKFRAPYTPAKAIGERLEIRSLVGDKRALTENKICDEPLCCIQLQRCIGKLQPLQCKLFEENALPAARPLLSGKMLLQLLIVALDQSTLIFAQILIQLVQAGPGLRIRALQRVRKRLRGLDFRSKADS